MTTGVKESTTGEIWTAGYGTGAEGDDLITDYRKVTEFKTWPDALDDMLRWAREYAESVDTDLRSEHLAGNKRELSANCVEVVEEYLRSHEPQMDEEVHLRITSKSTNETAKFCVERDRW